VAITFIANSSNNGFANSLDVTVVAPAAAQVGDLFVCCFAFDAQGAGSGPWVQTAPAGWFRIIYQAPSGTGSAIEVWATINVIGGGSHFVFTNFYKGNVRESVYRGFNPVNNAVLSLLADAQSAQTTGDNPVCPSATSDENGSIGIACASNVLSGVGFGYPAGWTKRWDNSESGSFGDIEDCLGDKIGLGIGATGTVPLTASVTPAGALGTTCTIVFRIDGITATAVTLPFLGVGP